MRRSSSNPPFASKSAFTLVEMLVATAVLVLLIVMVAQLTNSATTTITGSRKRLDADGQARLIFDRMANDFANMVKRKDVDCIFKSGTNGVGRMTGNDAMYFFSEAPGFSSSSGTNSSARSSIALVGYRISGSNQYFFNSPVLERLGKNLTWDGSPSSSASGGMVFLTYSGTTPLPASTISGNWGTAVGTPPYTTGTDADYHVLSEQVYRLEYNFLLKPFVVSTGTTLNGASYAAGASVPAVISEVPWDIRQGHTTVNGLQDVSAIIVALGILDPGSRKITSTTNFNHMITALPDASGTNEIMQLWQGAVSGTGANTYQSNTGPLNNTAFSQLRYYQRYFYLNNN